MGDHCKAGTVNSADPDVASLGAALADARCSGALSEGYYRSADDTLDRLAARLAKLEAVAECAREAACCQDYSSARNERCGDCVGCNLLRALAAVSVGRRLGL